MLAPVREVFDVTPRDVVYSLDGFITREDGSLDWLEHDSGGDHVLESDPGGEDHGFTEFFDSVDTMVMARRFA
ncbi:MAG: hypothetical protein QF357_10445 [Dehalococcoidia bacterium]|jgi:hypothetical protein|nr:hypothetical protein [Dehalococcoidia bacterium]